MSAQNNNSITNEDYLNVEFYELTIQQLDTQRQKITKRGRLTAAEDRRLDEIDAEIAHFYVLIDEILAKQDNSTEESTK